MSESGEVSPRLFVQPDGVVAVDVVQAEIVLGIEALHVRVPSVVDLLPADRQQGRILLHDGLRLADQRLAFGWLHLPVDLQQEVVERFVVPERMVLRTIGTVPGAEVIRRVEQRRDDDAQSKIEIACLGVVEPG